MNPSIKGKRVALLVTDGFEQVELTGPRQALEQAGATVHILAPTAGTVTGWHHTTPADRFRVDHTLDSVRIDDYDALVLPGGVVNADTLRTDPLAQELVRDAARADKPIAVICHGAWLLASADLVKGKTLTSWPSLTDDLRNAGAHWVDQEVVVDGRLISSRKPDDIPAFNQRLLEALAA
ncbi:type 1 glutamine amidotransferase domain-containing protein [Metapseudomonas otitidis]|jgi:protease I|uniref:DJ-1/PfpI/YhbO family deglycase/protease n=1 Tax=Metapseudomonas otitidis TaxID=319939 RepID=A0A679G8D4_9GAMM|nr:MULTISPECIES: type 1 glutamine amidotransferase domain-containing protein [Pseudomonas]KIV73433.1 ThiJ/PfpI family protein [Pseudomonas sp. FeS53a]MBO2927600.1 type 1 glutamine amidotransferase [Pseudomonas otitidis]MDH0337707.1 type 1 glutamine amidotransferase [Pseudomonas otitidis]MDH1107562.1 type 1 glutamine amidotransferase [Pseudomonas otitidis]MDH1161218.1 type 1 glutamine amidotransferase [Pseudomonas otitidis]